MSLPTMIAIDGPAASGKSTVALELANRLNYLFFDTGIMYRAAALASLRILQGVEDESAVSDLANRIQIDVRPASRDDGRLCDVILDDEDVTWAIRAPEVDANVSQVSAYAGVRAALTLQQRRIGTRGDVIMVGRDIGTIVFPEAPLKIYLDASVEERARRRFEEAQSRGGTTPYAEILASMRRRDHIDSTRAIAPLRPAEDAVIVNTDGLDIHQVIDQVLELINRT